MRKHLENYFEFSHLGTNWRTEILAGVTTFLTMAYIVLVNPAILVGHRHAAACHHGGHVSLRCVRLHPHGRRRALSYRARAWHGTQRLFHLHRVPQNAYSLADRAGELYFFPALSFFFSLRPAYGR